MGPVSLQEGSRDPYSLLKQPVRTHCSSIQSLRSLPEDLSLAAIVKSLVCICVVGHEGFPGGASSKEPPACQGKRHRRLGFDPWVGKIPWRRAWQPTPVFLLGESHGQRSLEVYSPRGHKESDTTEVTAHTHAVEHDFINNKKRSFGKGNMQYVSLKKWNIKPGLCPIHLNFLSPY